MACRLSPSSRQPAQEPSALAIDASDNVYIGSGTVVSVYSPGAVKLLRTITNGLYAPQALLIASLIARRASDPANNTEVTEVVFPQPRAAMASSELFQILLR
jgi:hypothetical protein